MTSLLLPTPGDPLILDTWLRNYKKYEHLIDECIICINGVSVPVDILINNLHLVNYWNSISKNYSKIKVFFSHYLNDHGLALKLLYERSIGDIIFLMEDDNYILDIHFLENCIKKVKSREYDIVGVPRNSCSEEITQQVEFIFNRKSPSFWPTHFIVTRELLDKTDINFETRVYNANCCIKELNNYIPTNKLVSDTMVYLSLQLINKSRKIFDIQTSHHSFIDETFDKVEHCSDLHIGSFSSTFPCLLFFDNMNIKPIEDYVSIHINDKNTILEYFRRFVYLKEFLKKIPDDVFYKKPYTKNLNNIYCKYSHLFSDHFDPKLISFLTNKI